MGGEFALNKVRCALRRQHLPIRGNGELWHLELCKDLILGGINCSQALVTCWDFGTGGTVAVSPAWFAVGAVQARCHCSSS